jgi:hypothetical protein
MTMWNYKNDIRLEEAISSNNHLRLRSMVKGVLMDDPADSEGLAVELIDYIKRSVPDIMQPHEDRTEMLFDKSKWTEEYRDLMAGALIENFSEKRFLHLLEVGKYVYPKKATTVKPTPKNQRDSDIRKLLLLGAATGLVLGLILLKLSTPIGATLAAASIAGGAYALAKGAKRA